MTASSSLPIQNFLPTSSTAISIDSFEHLPLPSGEIASTLLKIGSSLLIEVYSFGLNYLKENSLEIGTTYLSAEAFDKLSKNNVKLLFQGSKLSETLIEQFQGKLQKSGSSALSPVTSPKEFCHDIREANVSFMKKKLIGMTLQLTNQFFQLKMKRYSLLKSKISSVKNEKEFNKINLEYQQTKHLLAWMIAEIGFSIIVSSSYDKNTAKISKELGKFIFWGKGEPLKNFHAFREALEKSGAIAPFKEGDLATAINQIDEKTVSVANKVGIDVITYVTAGLKAVTMLGAESLEHLSNASGNLFMSWKLANLLWDPNIASTPKEERSWFVRLFTDHYHSARNERANRLLTRNINPYR